MLSFADCQRGDSWQSNGATADEVGKAKFKVRLV